MHRDSASIGALGLALAATLIAGVVAGVDGNGSAATSRVSAPRATIYVAPNGSDARSCRSPQAACASFDRANRVAKAGETVDVAGGRYASQVIQASGARGAPNVVFRPARGASVVLGGLTFGEGGERRSGPTRITVRDMKLVVQRLRAGCAESGGCLRRAGLERHQTREPRCWELSHLVRGSRVQSWAAITARAMPLPVRATSAETTRSTSPSNVTVDGALIPRLPVRRDLLLGRRRRLPLGVHVHQRRREHHDPELEVP